MISRWNISKLRKKQKFKSRKKFILILLIIDLIKVKSFNLILLAYHRNCMAQNSSNFHDTQLMTHII